MSLLVHHSRFHRRPQHLDDEALTGYKPHAKTLISGRGELNLIANHIFLGMLKLDSAKFVLVKVTE